MLKSATAHLAMVIVIHFDRPVKPYSALWHQGPIFLEQSLKRPRAIDVMVKVIHHTFLNSYPLEGRSKE